MKAPPANANGFLRPHPPAAAPEGDLRLRARMGQRPAPSMTILPKSPPPPPLLLLPLLRDMLH